MNFQEVFSQVHLADSIKLPSWCISVVVPLCYMSGMMVTAMQQDEDVAAASKPQCSLAPDPSSSLVHPPRMPPLPVPPLLDIPLVGTPPVVCPFAEFLAISTQKKWGCSPSGLLDHHHNKRICVDSQEVEARSDHCSAHGDEDTPKVILETGTSFWHKGRNQSVPPPVKLGPPSIQKMGPWQGTRRVPEIRPLQNQSHQGRMWMTLTWTHSPETMSHAQTQMRCLFKLFTRSTRRGYGLPVD